MAYPEMGRPLESGGGRRNIQEARGKGKENRARKKIAFARKNARKFSMRKHRFSLAISATN
ncbi:hypothetical protein GOD68_17905 [Sinorhizobium medicae]|nr:hypothetical protein [Sinorhizobium medicae]MDX0671896.1 hypothetical protein [Sinorhizobium medicae]MDX0709176.1 hypothetical protein [Sinorhizobium medicae]